MAKHKPKLKETIEKQLASMLESEQPPNDARMKLLKLGIAYLAVNAKLEESEYGGFFDEDGDTGVRAEEGKKSRSGKREAGSAELGIDGRRLDS